MRRFVVYLKVGPYDRSLDILANTRKDAIQKVREVTPKDICGYDVDGPVEIQGIEEKQLESFEEYEEKYVTAAELGSIFGR